MFDTSRSLVWASRALSCALVLRVVCASTDAFAQSDAEVAAHRQLIDDARRSAASGDHVRAIDLATRASRLRMTPSLRAFLAAELLANGQAVRAMSNAEQCASELRRDATASDRERLIADCQRLAQQASERVGRISVEGVDETLAGLSIRVQGELLNAALIGVATVVDPGNVVVEVTATGYRPLRQEARVEARQTVIVRIALEREPAAANPTPPHTQQPVDPPPQTRPIVRAPARPAARPSLVGPIAVSAVGGASLVLGGVFFALQANAFGDCHVEGVENVCDKTTTIEAARPAVTFNRVALVSTIAGAAVLAGGVTWLLFATRSNADARAVTLAPVADATSASLVLRGAL